MWARELEEMKRKARTSKNQSFIKQVKNIDEVQMDTKEAALRRFIAACKYKHALAFFQWRSMYSPGKNPSILQAVFDARVDLIDTKH